MQTHFFCNVSLLTPQGGRATLENNENMCDAAMVEVRSQVAIAITFVTSQIAAGMKA
jgi:hypothetical protein